MTLQSKYLRDRGLRKQEAERTCRERLLYSQVSTSFLTVPKLVWAKPALPCAVQTCPRCSLLPRESKFTSQPQMAAFAFPWEGQGHLPTLPYQLINRAFIGSLLELRFQYKFQYKYTFQYKYPSRQSLTLLESLRSRPRK